MQRSLARSLPFAVALLAAAAACSAPRRTSLADDSAPIAAQATEAHAARADDADALFAAGKWPAAEAAFRARVDANPKDAAAWHKLGYALHVQGKLEAAAEAHARAATFPGQRAGSLYNLACAKALLGEPDQAFEALDGAATAGFHDAATLASDGDLASLRADPRWSALAARVAGEAGGKRRELDFWLGEWDVLDPSGNRIGGNLITKHERGNLIHERWTDAGGGTGQSLNFVDPSDGLWKQVWVDDKGGVIRYSGSLKDGALCFEGVHAVGPSQERPSRCTFTPQPDGSVLQKIEGRGADGNWTVTFLGRYVRKAK